jgi:hypothetical protein
VKVGHERVGETVFWNSFVGPRYGLLSPQFLRLLELDCDDFWGDFCLFCWCVFWIFLENFEVSGKILKIEDFDRFLGKFEGFFIDFCVGSFAFLGNFMGFGDF